MDQTMLQQYMDAVSTNQLHNNNRSEWEFLLNSYMGGQDYAETGFLTKYVNETPQEYGARVSSTYLENHSKSVVSTYVSFLFRECPDRDYGMLSNEPNLEQFLKDADMDGRSFDGFMKEASIWSSVFGHCWILVVKPNVGATTLGDEVTIGVRPYLTLLTPLTVMDWAWEREITGRHVLKYLKYTEEVNDTFTTIREWTPELITTTVVNHQDKTVFSKEIEINGLNAIPAVICYNQRSPVRGIGVSDISDIARASKFVYNLTSEVEQSVRVNGHPALVKTVDTEASAGAGAIVQMPDNMDPGLKPYMLSVSTDINSIYGAISHTVDAIDKMANTGAIRATQARTLSGVAQEQEFQLLNAKLSEKADNLELAEEQIWQWYAQYQGREWTGEIHYPDSFNIKDKASEIARLVQAKSAATDPRVLALIDHEIVEWLGEDADIVLPELATLANGQEVPLDSTEPFAEPEEMFNPETGESAWIIDFQSKRDLMARGWVEKED